MERVESLAMLVVSPLLPLRSSSDGAADVTQQLAAHRVPHGLLILPDVLLRASSLTSFPSFAFVVLQVSTTSSMALIALWA